MNTMNTVLQPRERTPLDGGEVRTIELGLRFVEIDPQGVLFERPERRGQAYSLTKAQAIKAAEAILLAYNVPFKNAVKGAGVGQ